MDTIYALSSGTPPAAIAVIRISGPGADAALASIAGRLPPARRASLSQFRDPGSGLLLDNGLILRFPGPNSATGEDLVELHLHGGRSVVAALLAALATLPHLREAQPGEFTRRAFANGRIDLAEAEGLGDLLLAETETQRRAALALAGGSLSRLVESWQDRLLTVAAMLEATIDHSDEDDVGDADVSISCAIDSLIADMSAALSAPSSERMRDGIRIVIAGPPNVGKSSLFNVLAGREAAITSPMPGTTRDVVEAPTAIAGLPLLLIDTAGLRESEDEVERIGIARATGRVADADILLWLGGAADCPPHACPILVQSKADLDQEPRASGTAIRVSALTGEGIEDLVQRLLQASRELLPREDQVALNRRHRALIESCLAHLTEARLAIDPLIAAEALRQARSTLDQITGRAGVEQMLDSLFGRFCIGK